MTDRHVMLDLETMDTAPTAAVIQLGAIEFDVPGDQCHNHFQRTISLQSSLLAGGTMSPDTLAWWRRQSDAACLSVSSNADRLEPALSEFSTWLPEDAYIWSHGASFDIPVLDHAYRSLGMKPPWDHRRVRDTRTVFWLAQEWADWRMPETITAHTALADAISQAATLQSALTRLRTFVGF